MKTVPKEIISITANSVLFVGDPSVAFSNPEAINNFNCRVCGNMLDAITLCSEEKFRTIFVVMGGFGGKLQSVLQTLRRVNSSAEIFLLAQMHQEPAAIDLTSRRRLATGTASDYFICPVNVETLWQKAGLTETETIEEPLVAIKSDYRDAKIRELEKLATEDDLTGLKNRRYVREFLSQVIERSNSQSLRVTLLVFDIDDFKHYNDAYGHAVGDHVLKQAAIMMLRCCREHDVVGRIGGDEFAVVFWDKSDNKQSGGDNKDDVKPASERRNTDSGRPVEAYIMAERFRKEVCSAELSFLGPEGRGELTISGGLASFPKDGKTVGELFEQADKVMLEVKRTGKNRVALVGKANAK
ncbi:MAG TPA: GGDEF domain-containing protein [Phycisphaerales bacterium]|nr:GGDEF domain-containing protein [Phycisphaerales bacterium]